MVDAGELCNREVVVAEPSEPLLDVARRMRDHRVGSIVVVEGPPGARVPVGIVTDRDLVVYAVAAGGTIPERPVYECMTPNVVTAHEREGLDQVLRRMRVHSIRRIPVINDDGVLQGILSIDDLIELLAEEVHDLADLLLRQRSETVHPG
jgi:CBS domain-containing protein